MRASQSCCCEDLKPQGHVINIPLGHLKKRCWVLFFFVCFFGWVGVVTCTFALFGQSEYMKPRGRCLTGRQYSTGRTIQRKGGEGWGVRSWRCRYASYSSNWTVLSLSRTCQRSIFLSLFLRQSYQCFRHSPLAWIPSWHPPEGKERCENTYVNSMQSTGKN